VIKTEKTSRTFPGGLLGKAIGCSLLSLAETKLSTFAKFALVNSFFEFTIAAQELIAAFTC